MSGDDFYNRPREDRLGDQPVSPEYRKKMIAVCDVLDKFFNGERLPGAPRETGFVLMVFKFGDSEGQCNYMSNGARRADVVRLMKEMIHRFEGKDN